MTNEQKVHSMYADAARHSFNFMNHQGETKRLHTQMQLISHLNVGRSPHLYNNQYHSIRINGWESKGGKQWWRVLGHKELTSENVGWVDNIDLL